MAAIISGVTLLIVLIGGGAMWGMLTEKVSGHARRLESQEDEIQRIDARLNGVDVDLGRLKEWKDGYNAAARVGGRTSEV